MAVDDARLRAAVDAITDVEGLSMDPDSLVEEDVYKRQGRPRSLLTKWSHLT